MKNKKHFKVRLIDLIIFFVLIFVLASIGTYVYLNKGILFEKTISQMDEEKNIEQEKVKNLGWDANLVEKVVNENVPIPTGYKKIEDEKAIIVEDQFKIQQMWIPYQEKTDVDVKKYFSKVKDYEDDLTNIESIKKYGGFYIDLRESPTIEELQSIDSKKYNQFVKNCKIINENENGNTVNQHIITRPEIAQVLQYFKNNNLKLEDYQVGITVNTIENFKKLNTTAIKDAIKDKENLTSGYAGMLDVSNNKKYDGYTNEIPIPKGYKYIEEDGIVKISDEKNENLVYIWVPLNAKSVEDIKNVKNELKKMYEEYTEYAEDSSTYKMLDNTTEEYSEEFIKSIIKYGGFYIGESELLYDKDKNYYSINVGNASDNAVNSKMDYLRSSNVNYATTEKIVDDLGKNSESVSTHIMYGVEYDAMLLWIMNTNEGINNKILENSSLMGNYKDSDNNSNIAYNGIYGIAGNLLELTQEKISNKINTGNVKKVTNIAKSDKIKTDIFEKIADNAQSSENYVVRGGSYNYSGNSYSAASRMSVSNNGGIKDIGFRVGLTLNEGTETVIINDMSDGPIQESVHENTLNPNAPTEEPKEETAVDWEKVGDELISATAYIRASDSNWTPYNVCLTMFGYGYNIDKYGVPSFTLVTEGGGSTYITVASIGQNMYSSRMYVTEEGEFKHYAIFSTTGAYARTESVTTRIDKTPPSISVDNNQIMTAYLERKYVNQTLRDDSNQTSRDDTRQLCNGTGNCECTIRITERNIRGNIQDELSNLYCNDNICNNKEKTFVWQDKINVNINVNGYKTTVLGAAHITLDDVYSDSAGNKIMDAEYEISCVKYGHTLRYLPKLKYKLYYANTDTTEECEDSCGMYIQELN